MILLLGSGPTAMDARAFPRDSIDSIVAINNAHAVRPDWDYLVHPWDFPADRMPASVRPGQTVVTETDFVPAMNAFGGFVYGGGTMAFTTAYWVLSALKPSVLAFFGCDMVYPETGPTHFYGTGTPDPLRADITLRSLEAKSARLTVLAALAGVAVVNLSSGPSRLVMDRARLDGVRGVQPAVFDAALAEAALRAEAEAGYIVPSGRYWEVAERFDPAVLDAIDRLWGAAAASAGLRKIV